MACASTGEDLFTSETKRREDEQIHKKINQFQPSNINIPSTSRFQSFLRASSKKDWTRIEDECLLLYLQEFSRQIVTKTTDVMKKVDNLDSEANGTRSRVRNVLNDFLMNSSEQFIENTIEEEDFSVKEKNKIRIKNNEQKQKEIYDNYVKAISYGLEYLDKSYVTIPIKCIDDSAKIEDFILAPKSEREDRPLPPLIGSTNFFRVESIDLKESFPPDDDGDKDEGGNYFESGSDSDEGEYILLDSDEEERIKWNFRKKPNAEALDS